MKFRSPVITVIAMITLVSGTASATPVTAAYIMANYNLVTSGDATTQSDIEGSAVIGGSLNGATMFGNRKPSSPELDVYGTVSGNLNVSGGLVDYGTKAAGTNLNLNSGAIARQGGFTHLLSDFITPLNQLSASLASLNANSTIVLGSGKVTFVASPVNGTAVFSLTAAQLQTDLNNNSVFFNQNGAEAIVVNITGNFTDPSSSNWNPPVQQDVIFNFIDATAASISVRNWEGSILAPNASLSIIGGNIEGFVYAASFQGGGELHNLPFTGILPNEPIPEPATIAILGGAVAGLGFVTQRRRA